jgi:hypothetical protein
LSYPAIADYLLQPQSEASFRGVGLLLKVHQGQTSQSQRYHCQSQCFPVLPLSVCKDKQGRSDDIFQDDLEMNRLQELPPGFQRLHFTPP